MTRDSYVLIGFLGLFAVANASLVASGVLTLDWDGIGVIVAAGCTLALYSFLYKDNPLFKFAEHVYVGVAAAYIFGITWYNSLYGEILVSYFDIGAEGASGGGHNPWVLLFPTLLGLLMLTRFSSKFGWLSRISFAFVVGVGGADIALEDALSHVAGYTVANDLTARHLQGADRKEGWPWFRSKNFPGS